MGASRPQPADQDHPAGRAPGADTGSLIEAVVQSTSLGVMLIGADGLVSLVNPGMERILGVTPEMAVGRPVQSLLRCGRHARDPVCPAQVILDAWDTGQHSVSREAVCVAPERSLPTMVVVTTFPLAVSRDGRGRHGGLVAVLQDVTQHKMLRDLLAASERLSVVGQLIVYSSHDMRGPLTSIKGLAQLIQMNRIDAATRTRYAATIGREVDELDRMVAGFLRMARQPTGQPLAVDLVQVARETLDLVAAKAMLQRVTTSLIAEQPEVCLATDPFKLKHALLNLAINSLQAMPDGGRLEIAVSLSRAGDRQTTTLSVADSGPGVDPDALQRVFEPFYTTREYGTGLGLPVTRMTACELGGWLEAVGHGRLGGLEVTIHLPAPAAKPRDPGAQCPPEAGTGQVGG